MCAPLSVCVCVCVSMKKYECVCVCHHLLDMWLILCVLSALEEECRRDDNAAKHTSSAVVSSLDNVVTMQESQEEHCIVGYSQLKLGKALGKGSYGKVQETVVDGLKVAVKEFDSIKYFEIENGFLDALDVATREGEPLHPYRPNLALKRLQSYLNIFVNKVKCFNIIIVLTQHYLYFQNKKVKKKQTNK